MFRFYCRIGKKNQTSDLRKLATFRSRNKWLTLRPTGIYKYSIQKMLLRPSMNENLSNWCGNISSLVWKYFFSGVEIFLLWCGHFSSLSSLVSIFFCSYKNIPFQRRKIRREIFVVIRIIFTTPVKKFE